MPREQLPESWATEYFRRDGTVGEWWDPLSNSDPDFRQWFVAQLEDIVAVTRPGGSKILDAAVGRGRATVAMAEGGARSVVALDISTEMLSIAATNLRNVPNAKIFSFVQGDLHRMPFEDESFEIVLLLEVLLHVADPVTVLRECHRVLVPDGVLVVTTNGANPLSRLLQPPKRGSRPASRFRLFIATLANEVMTTLFGFTWRRLRLTGALYQRVFSALFGRSILIRSADHFARRDSERPSIIPFRIAWSPVSIGGSRFADPDPAGIPKASQLILFEVRPAV